MLSNENARDRERTFGVLVVFDLIPDRTYKSVVQMTESEYDYFKVANEYIVNLSPDNELGGAGEYYKLCYAQ